MQPDLESEMSNMWHPSFQIGLPHHRVGSIWDSTPATVGPWLFCPLIHRLFTTFDDLHLWVKPEGTLHLCQRACAHQDASTYKLQVWLFTAPVVSLWNVSLHIFKHASQKEEQKPAFKRKNKSFHMHTNEKLNKILTMTVSASDSFSNQCRIWWIIVNISRPLGVALFIQFILLVFGFITSKIPLPSLPSDHRAGAWKLCTVIVEQNVCIWSYFIFRRIQAASTLRLRSVDCPARESSLSYQLTIHVQSFPS